MWLLILFRIDYLHFCTVCTTLDLHVTTRDVSAFPRNVHVHKQLKVS
jgi:hypothetical protein